MVLGTSYLLVRRQAQQVTHVRKPLDDWGNGRDAEWLFCTKELRGLFSRGRPCDMGREANELAATSDEQCDGLEGVVPPGD